MASKNDPQLAERFYFNPKWWWDPIPDFMRERLTEGVAEKLTKIQLTKQHAILKAELEAVEATMRAFG